MPWGTGPLRAAGFVGWIRGLGQEGPRAIEALCQGGGPVGAQRAEACAGGTTGPRGGQATCGHTTVSSGQEP